MSIRTIASFSILFSTVLVPGALLAKEKEEKGFVSIFDGKSFKGWKQLGGKAKFHVEDECIVGTTVPKTPNSFMTTEKKYGDFELELEYKVSPKLNSGVQIRSQVRPNGRVYGYQVEIDPDVKRGRLWSGGIYDESRRGWLNDLKNNEPARKAFRPEQWNKYRVVCEGDSLKTWINGVAAADLVDSLTPEGFIGLQVHSYRGAEPVQVRWRSIHIKDNGRHVWKPLFDGKSLEGWEKQGGGEWRIDKGVLIGKNIQSEKEHGHLFLEKPVKDVTLRVVYKAISGNSGLYFRTEKRSGAVGIAGFQAEIDATKDAGGLYETNGRAWVAQPDPKRAQKYFKPQDWNEMTVSAHGRRIVVHVNGTKSAELLNDPGRLEGFVALQVHGSQDMEVHFKSIEMLVKEK